MTNQNFGVEIELTGITRCAAAKVIAGYFSAEATHVRGSYDVYTIRDNNMRQWKIMSDSSIQCEARGNRSANIISSQIKQIIALLAILHHSRVNTRLTKQTSFVRHLFAHFAPILEQS